jgi:hypothetical protein
MLVSWVFPFSQQLSLTPAESCLSAMSRLRPAVGDPQPAIHYSADERPVLTEAAAQIVKADPQRAESEGGRRNG